MPPPTGEHPLPKRPSKSDRSPKVDLNHPIELLKGVVRELPNPRHPSIGDENVDVTTLGRDPLNLIPQSKISSDDATLNLPSKPVKGLHTAASEREHAPFVTQPPSNGLPQSTRSPGNKNRPPTKFHVRMVMRPSTGPPRRTVSHHTHQARLTT